VTANDDDDDDDDNNNELHYMCGEEQVVHGTSHVSVAMTHQQRT